MSMVIIIIIAGCSIEVVRAHGVGVARVRFSVPRSDNKKLNYPLMTEKSF